MAPIRKNYNKKPARLKKVKSDRQATLSVVTLRISDEEKQRIDEIMKNNDIKRYSDVMIIAIKMVSPLNTGA